MTYARSHLEAAAASEYDGLVLTAYREYQQSVEACGRRLATALSEAGDVKRYRLSRIDGMAVRDEDGKPVLPPKGPGSRQEITSYVRTVIEQNTFVNGDTSAERLALSITHSVLHRLGFMELGDPL